VTRDAQVSLEAHFFVATPTVDLDNLAKPVLDTLFNPNKKPNQARLKDVPGVLFDIQDDAVIRLLLTKTLVTDPSKIGVMISATW
jgi:hypothetical protein